MSRYKLTVGLEIHVQLKTKTKMFCGCPNDPFHSKPNENVCPVCYGLPGALPLLNKEAIKKVVEFGQTIGATIPMQTFWARKNYFYPDLPKGYQISQSTAPLVQGGRITVNGTEYHLNHAHLEEDAGKLIHQSNNSYSLVDYNRAGTPLLEIVTEPDFHTPEAAKLFCQELQRIVRHLEMSDADMEKGQMRCEANISVSKTEELGTKVEVKNINSFRHVERAIAYEYERQVDRLEAGETIAHETRTWNDAAGKTVSMRGKETSADYRYFPEPDLPVIEIPFSTLAKKQLPEERRRALIEVGISEAIAKELVDKKLDEAVMRIKAHVPDLVRDAAYALLEWPEFASLSAADQAALLKAKMDNGWTKEAANNLLHKVAKGESLEEVFKEFSSQDADLAGVIKEVITANPKPVTDFKSGKPNALHFLVGQVMAKTQGRANINNVRAELEKLLS